MDDVQVTHHSEVPRTSLPCDAREPQETNEYISEHGCNCRRCPPPALVSPTPSGSPVYQLSFSQFLAMYGVPDIDRLPPSSSPTASSTAEIYVRPEDITLVMEEDEVEGAGLLERTDILIRAADGTFSTPLGKRVFYDPTGNTGPPPGSSKVVLDLLSIKRRLFCRLLISAFPIVHILQRPNKVLFCS